MKGSDSKQFHCSFPGCDKVFNRRDYLERHATNHLTVKPFVCVQCNRHFSRKDLYDNHLTTKRHARVAHEVGQTSQDKVERHRDSRGDSWDQLSNSPASHLSYETKAQPQQALSLGGSQDLGTSDPRMRYDTTVEYSPTGISSYAPPLIQPLYLPGPGPGDVDMRMQEAEDQEPEYQSSSEASKAPSNGKLFAGETGPGFFSEEAAATSAGRKFEQEMKLASENLEMGMSWEPSADNDNTIPKETDGISGKDGMQEEEAAQFGQFSTYGVSLNLDSSAASSSVRSEDNTSDESSDMDSRNSAFAVDERIRNDMVINPLPFPGLRENDQFMIPEPDVGIKEPSLFRRSDSASLPQELGVSNEDMLAVKEDAPKQAASLSDAVITASRDKRYAWFFDDVFETSMSKLGYDRCYSDSVESYEQRSSEFSRDFARRKACFDRAPGMQEENSQPTAPNGKARASAELDRSLLSEYPSITRKLQAERATKVLAILKKPQQVNGAKKVEKWMNTAWSRANAVRHIVHPAIYDPNSAHLSLLAVLALIGQSLSDERRAASSAKKSYAPVFLYAYNAVAQLPTDLTPNKADMATVNKLQAFALLLRYERLITLGDRSKLSFTKNAQGRYVSDMFLGKVLAIIPHVGQFSTQTKQQPIWATISTEGYMFHQGADYDTQWREWVLIESAKRTAHFALYCDSKASHFAPQPNQVSIFNLDIHMICPDALWRGNSANEFFYISGPTGIVVNVPYLNLIKSLIRFPRSGKNEDVMMHALPQIRAPWSLGVLKSLAHGLIKIVSNLSAFIPHGDEMLQSLMQSREEHEHKGDVFSKFDRQVQARLYRGLDVWYHYFTATYGDITEQLLRVPESASIAITDDFDPPQEPQDGNAIPQYALTIVLCHYSSFIFMHEDLPVVLQVTANLKSWLETHESKSLQLLLDYLYMPLYTNWFKTDEAKGLVSASSMYLLWMHAVTGHETSVNHMFLSAMIYISTIVLWLYDFAANYDKMGERPASTYSKLRLDNFQFMEDAAEYILSVYKNVCGQGPAPERRAVNSVLLLGACLLNKRKSTTLLVEMLVQFVSVMDPDHSPESLMATVKASSAVYDERAARVRPAAAGSFAGAGDAGTSQDSSRGSSPGTDSEIDEMLGSNLADLNEIPITQPDHATVN